MAFVRDPAAVASMGRDAYYRFAAVLGDEARDQGDGLLRRLVEVDELGCVFTVPVGCLKEAKRGADEFWETLPPVVCRQITELSTGWEGTNEKGERMGARALVSLARQQDAGKQTHAFGSIEKPQGQAARWGPLPHPDAEDDGQPIGTADLLVALAAEPKRLLDEYLRLRVRGLDDGTALEGLVSEARGRR